MRFLAAGGLLLYGFANLFAAAVDLLRVRRLAWEIDAALLATGGVLALSGILALRRSKRAFMVAACGLALTFGGRPRRRVAAAALAIFNERVLGLGDPSHHIFRGAYSLLVLWAVYR